ncbi:MAG: septum formation initiator family protein, partial [Candidatus Weimeria sp.]
MITLVIQLFALNSKYQSYKAREAQLNEELEEQKEKKQDLKDYEKYTKTKEYTESQARSKLGLLYDNEIIFKEK